MFKINEINICCVGFHTVIRKNYDYWFIKCLKNEKLLRKKNITKPTKCLQTSLNKRHTLCHMQQPGLTLATCRAKYCCIFIIITVIPQESQLNKGYFRTPVKILHKMNSFLLYRIFFSVNLSFFMKFYWTKTRVTKHILHLDLYYNRTTLQYNITYCDYLLNLNLVEVNVEVFYFECLNA